MGEPTTLKAFEDPDHPGNRIRPEARCLGCGKLGCVTYWGDWCFDCNVVRIRRISASLERLAARGSTDAR